MPTENCAALHYPQWLSAGDADACYKLSLQLNWQQNVFPLFGKEVMLPRREIIFGDPGIVYSYSGRVRLEAAPWQEELLKLRDKLQQFTGHPFRLVIGNRYDSGADHIGWHDDGRKELGQKPAISSLSLGTTRTFQVRRKPAYKGERTEILSYQLQHGDLFVMPLGFQESHKHRLRKDKTDGTRINWTFRPWVSPKSQGLP